MTKKYPKEPTETATEEDQDLLPYQLHNKKRGNPLFDDHDDVELVLERVKCLMILFQRIKWPDDDDLLDNTGQEKLGFEVFTGLIADTIEQVCYSLEERNSSGKTEREEDSHEEN